MHHVLHETIRWPAARDWYRFDRWPAAAQFCISRDKSYEEKCECLIQIFFHFRSLHYCVQETMLQQKLAGLKTIRKFLSYGLFDDARTCESDQRSRFGDVKVAQH